MIAPLYIYFLGLIFKFSHDSLMVARTVQVVLGTFGALGGALAIALALGSTAFSGAPSWWNLRCRSRCALIGADPWWLSLR